MDDFAEDGFARDGFSDDDFLDGDFSENLPGKEAFKEFQGKDLDSAIEEACVYFNAGRERLEIEIVQDAKSGLFGLIGARKAKVRARRARLRDTVRCVLGELHAGRSSRASRRERGETRPRAKGERGQAQESEHAARKDRSRKFQTEREPSGREPSGRRMRDAGPSRERGAERPRAGLERNNRGRDARNVRDAESPKRDSEAARTRKERKERISPDESVGMSVQTSFLDGPMNAPENREDAKSRDALPLWDEAAGERMTVIAVSWVNRLLERLAGHPCAFETRAEGHLGQVDIVLVPKDLDTPDGLPREIARDADIMGAVEHLASRLLSREARLAAKVVIDADETRERRDDKIVQAAMELAKRALAYDKPQATEPLSSQDRRIVHLALKEVAGVRTKSLGKGHMRQVLIMPKKPGFDANAADLKGVVPDAAAVEGAEGSNGMAGMEGDAAQPEPTAFVEDGGAQDAAPEEPAESGNPGEVESPATSNGPGGANGQDRQDGQDTTDTDTDTDTSGQPADMRTGQA